MSDSLDANKFGDIRSALQEGDVQWPYVAAMLNSMSEGRHKIAAATAIVERAMVLGQFDDWVVAQYLNKGVHHLDFFEMCQVGNASFQALNGEWFINSYTADASIDGPVQATVILQCIDPVVGVG